MHSAAQTLDKSAVVAVFAFTAALTFAIPSFGGNQLMLTGNVLTKCTVDATPNPDASNLPLTSAGAQHVLIATVNQDCNGKRGYTLGVVSTNCLAAPAGAKVVDTASGDFLSYSIESLNPTDGGSNPDVSGLLATQCSDQIARDVTRAVVKSENSTFYANFQGSSSLSAGTYQDVLTVTLTLK